MTFFVLTITAFGQKKLQVEIDSAKLYRKVSPKYLTGGSIDIPVKIKNISKDTLTIINPYTLGTLHSPYIIDIDGTQYRSSFGSWKCAGGYGPHNRKKLKPDSVLVSKLHIDNIVTLKELKGLHFYKVKYVVNDSSYFYPETEPWPDKIESDWSKRVSFKVK